MTSAPTFGSTTAPRIKSTHSFARESDNWYVEPADCTAALCRAEAFSGRTVDPCAGMGRTIEGARQAGVHIEGYDLRHRGNRTVAASRDFFSPHQLPRMWPCENIVSNPPYGAREYVPVGERKRLEEHFIELALERAQRKVAVFLHSTWMNGEKRQKWLSSLPLHRVYLVSPRPSCLPGHLIQAGEKACGGTKDYAWFVFLNGFEGDAIIRFLRRSA